VDGYGLVHAHRANFYDRLLDVAVHSARAEVLLHGVTAESTTAVAADGYPILWGIAWRARSASWIARNRQLLQRALS
jgi:membrane-bound ClpP family serine protease